MPEPPPVQSTPIPFRDFRPGIADIPSLGYPPEQASRTNTYRCIANRTGALTPLPRRDISHNGVLYEASNPDAGYYLINGFFVPTYTVGTSPTSGNDLDGRLHPIFMGVSYAKGGNTKTKVELFKQWQNPFVSVTVEATSTASADTGASGHGMTFGLTRANRAAPTSPGVPIVVWANANSEGGAPRISYFPNDAAPAVDGVFGVSTGLLAILAVHQGRIVIGRATSYGFGATGFGATSEDLFWTNVNDPDVLSVVQSFVPENPNGYGFIFPMSANELLLMKQVGGASIIGDLDNPTVVNLPMLVGCDFQHTPAALPIGLAYGNVDSGIWLWQHGDTSTLISEGMLSNFWFPSVLVSASRCTFAAWDDWLLVPNNFLYDTQIKSWWLLEDQASFLIHRWGTWTKFAYGSIRSYTHAAPTAMYGWRKDLNATSYSWQSHPIWQAQDRILAIREVELIAKGKGTVTLTLTAADGSTTSEAIVLANTGLEERFRRDFYIQGYNITLRIQADSGDTTEAPSVIEVLLHPDTRSRIPVR